MKPNTIIHGDCGEVLFEQAKREDFIDLIITSPPYGMRRKETYGGIPADEYVEWFLTRSRKFIWALKPTGSFVLNIKEHCEDGERHRYVYELVLALRDQGWRLVDELIWHKKNAMPGKFTGRFRDGWERIYHFTKAKGHYCNKEAVMVPTKEGTKKRYRQALKNNAKREESRTGSGFGADKGVGLSRTGSGLAAGPEDQMRRGRKNSSGFGTNDARLDALTMAFPSNVIISAPETKNKGHPAVFPRAIPEFFIKALCPPGGLVLDPFNGSGTTCEVAKQLGRKYIGIEISEEYCELARERLAKELI